MKTSESPCLLGMDGIPVKQTHWTNVGLMLGHRLRCWPNIKPSLVQCIVLTGMVCWALSYHVSSQPFYHQQSNNGEIYLTVLSTGQSCLGHKTHFWSWLTITMLKYGRAKGFSNHHKCISLCASFEYLRHRSMAIINVYSFSAVIDLGRQNWCLKTSWRSPRCKD